MQPYNFKVWGIDPARMSSDWIDGRVLTPSLDEVIEGSLQRGRGDMGPNARFGYPLQGGCEMFVAGLAERVQARGGAFALNRTLVKARPEAAAGHVPRRGAGRAVGPPGDDRLRDALPERPAARPDRAPSTAPRRRSAGRREPASTAVVCVNLGINREKVTEKHWIYYPEAQDKYIFQRIFVQSNASPFTAPPGHSALTFEISHSKSKPLPVRGKRALIDACVAGLKRTDLWREGDEVVFEQVLGMPHAYIPFTPDRQRNLDVINAYLHGLGIYPIGRFGEWKYVNQDGAILSAKRVVESVQSGEAIRPAATSPSASGHSHRPDGGHGLTAVSRLAGAAIGPARIESGDEGPARRSDATAPGARRHGLEAPTGWIAGARVRPDPEPIVADRAVARTRPRGETTRRCPGSASARAAATSRPRTGEPFLIIGQNDALTWPELEGLLGRRDLPSVDRHLAWLQAHGVTTLRVMLEYVGDGLYLERRPGEFDPVTVQADRRPGRALRAARPAAAAHAVRHLLHLGHVGRPPLQRRAGAAPAGVSSTS